MKRRLLSIGHSYCVGLNRRLPQSIARLAADSWAVTVAAPAIFHGDLKLIATEPEPGELPTLRMLPAHLAQRIHFFVYGRGTRSLLKESWDLIHMWEEPYILAGGEIAFMTPGTTPLVYATNQNVPKKYPPIFSQLERYCYKRCSGWLTMGRTTLETQLARGFGGKPCEMISPGVDTDAFKPDPAARTTMRQRLGWDDAPIPVIGYAGRFVPEKGLSFLMSILDRLKSPWRALFVGSGELQSQISQWAVRYGENVQIAGDVDHAAMPPYFNAIDVLCVPSQTMPKWREQFGRVIIEAFACGVPVVGSDSGEIPFVIEDAGIVVSERDSTAWIKALELLLDNPTERGLLGERARDLALTRHAHPVVARQHLDFFDRILASPRN